MSSPTAPLALPALLLAIGISTGGYFVSKTIYNSRVGLDTAEAKGLAERRVHADRANWTISHMVTGESRDEIGALYRKAEQDQGAILAVLTEGGLTDDEIDVDVISYSMREYRDENQILVDEKHTLAGTVNVETNNVKLVRNLRKAVNKLLVQDINLSNHSPSYHFTNINAVKPDMLKEAALNAKIAANEFAANAGVQVGRIRSARQGAFMVTDAGATRGDTRSLEKDVRVVTTVEFYLTD